MFVSVTFVVSRFRGSVLLKPAKASDYKRPTTKGLHGSYKLYALCYHAGGGGTQHRISLSQLQSEAFRSASQNQETTQAAQAFSGSQVTNTQTQVATLSQNANATNLKNIKINAVLATIANADSFNFNSIRGLVAGTEGANLLARGGASVAQNQGANQNGFARLQDFASDDSTVLNTLTQNAFVNQQFDVDLLVAGAVLTNGDELGSRVSTITIPGNYRRFQ